jgi:ABC-type transport system involved in multi-copper enzyme maturation permease subunit
MVWIALGLVAFTTAWIAINTGRDRWTMAHWRSPWRGGPSFQHWLDGMTAQSAAATAASPEGAGIAVGVTAAWRAALTESGQVIYSRWFVYTVFVGFVLPILSLSFATEALGGERESRSLVWLLSRPLSRPAIYAGKFAALLPWTLGLTLGGFALMCLAAGAPGRRAFELYWPAVAASSLAFAALFHLMSALFRRPAIMAIVYTFFLEVIVGGMPGYLKRVSIGFYTRCMMFEAAQTQGMEPPEKASIYLPVDSLTAWTVLLGLTAGLLVLGMLVFARSEYTDDL